MKRAQKSKHVDWLARFNEVRVPARDYEDPKNVKYELYKRKNAVLEMHESEEAT